MPDDHRLKLCERIKLYFDTCASMESLWDVFFLVLKLDLQVCERNC